MVTSSGSTECDDTENVYHTLKVDTVIPVNSQANLHIPTYEQEVTIHEGNSLIWNGSEGENDVRITLSLKLLCSIRFR